MTQPWTTCSWMARCGDNGNNNGSNRDSDLGAIGNCCAVAIASGKPLTQMGPVFPHVSFWQSNLLPHSAQLLASPEHCLDESRTVLPKGLTQCAMHSNRIEGRKIFGPRKPLAAFHTGAEEKETRLALRSTIQAVVRHFSQWRISAFRRLVRHYCKWCSVAQMTGGGYPLERQIRAAWRLGILTMSLPRWLRCNCRKRHLCRALT
ncbi:hypothetical protein B0T17DRAFT_292008 [Bombardia bombarda]|uniref:Uncharacterized protein n=1 Tax=Bombardia bombarda TaxID=252184 RepID=A0AA39WTX2_9PEZI|nr:hypothetical protein B0T17DRAFT_292008 [Bombardia bombarda]